MLVIRIELWPHGDAMRRKVLGVGAIANTGGTDTKGEYYAQFYGAGSAGAGSTTHIYEQLARGDRPTREPWRQCRLFDFPRKRRGAWYLLLMMLTVALGEDLKKK